MPQVFACLCVIARELKYARERFGDQDCKRTCPRCGDETEYEDKLSLGNWHCALGPDGTKEQRTRVATHG